LYGFEPLFFRLLLLLAGSLPSIAQAQVPIEGDAVVVKGDTLEIGGQRLHLHGITAPDEGASSRMLADRIGQSNVSCKSKGTETRVVCVVGGIELNAWMVEQGWAMADRREGADYVRLEDLARKFGRGIWATSIQLPPD
jgi:endonuclease YncB( thermonuclease family)